MKTERVRCVPAARNDHHEHRLRSPSNPWNASSERSDRSEMAQITCMARRVKLRSKLSCIGQRHGNGNGNGNGESRCVRALCDGYENCKLCLSAAKASFGSPLEDWQTFRDHPSDVIMRALFVSRLWHSLRPSAGKSRTL